MIEQNINPDEDSEINPNALTPADELKLLKERAKALGIPLGGNIGVDALKKKIADKLSGAAAEKEEDEVNEEIPAVQAKKAAKARPKTKAEIEQETRERLYKEKMLLVRCRIYNMNPSKRDLQGEIITIANRYLGTVRKFIPFGEATDGGYHIPKVIYDDLKSRKFQQIRVSKVRGVEQVTTRMVPEYSIEVLPPLTREELNELALKQAAAERLGNQE